MAKKDMRPPIIVTGPAGCGKTRAASRLAFCFYRGTDDIVDEWTPGQPLQPGGVHLTSAIVAAVPGAVVIDWCVLNSSITHPSALELPPQHPFTCGTDHVRAQAVLAIVAQLATTANQVDAPTIKALDNLVSDAGIEAALRIIDRETSLPF